MGKDPVWSLFHTVVNTTLDLSDNYHVFSDTDLGNSKTESFTFPKIVGNDYLNENLKKKLFACSSGVMEMFKVDI